MAKAEPEPTKNLTYNRYCRKSKKALPTSHYFTDEALICKKCQLAQIKKIV